MVIRYFYEIKSVVSIPKTLYLIRHGKTGQSGRYIGSMDIPLSAAGVKQIQGLHATLLDNSFDHVLASPMLRCRQSCEILFPDQPIHYSEKLREIDFGRWEGLNFQEIASKDQGLIEQWVENPLAFQFPEGEEISSFITRIKEVAKELSQLEEKKVCVLCHGGVIRGLLCQFLGIEEKNYLLFQVEKGKYTTVDLYGTKGVLTGLNLQ